MLNINIIKHIALALVASIALAGAAHAQAGKAAPAQAAAAKKEKEPVFTGTLWDLRNYMVATSGSTSQFINQHKGAIVVLEAPFAGYFVTKDWPKPRFLSLTVTLDSNADKQNSSGGWQVVCTSTNEALEKTLRELKRGHMLRVSGEITADSGLSLVSLASCKFH